MRVLSLIVVLIFSATLVSMLADDPQEKSEESYLTIKNKIRTLLVSNRLEAISKYLSELKQRGYNVNVLLNSQIAADDLPILHTALLVRDIDAKIISYLLNFGANPNSALTDNFEETKRRDPFLCKGFTPVYVAVRQKVPPAILKLLLNYGGNFFLIDSIGSSPKDIAIRVGNKEAKEFIEELEEICCIKSTKVARYLSKLRRQEEQDEWEDNICTGCFTGTCMMMAYLFYYFGFVAD